MSDPADARKRLRSFDSAAGGDREPRAAPTMTPAAAAAAAAEARARGAAPTAGSVAADAVRAWTITDPMRVGCFSRRRVL